MTTTPSAQVVREVPASIREVHVPVFHSSHFGECLACGAYWRNWNAPPARERYREHLQFLDLRENRDAYPADDREALRVVWASIRAAIAADRAED